MSTVPMFRTTKPESPSPGTPDNTPGDDSESQAARPELQRGQGSSPQQSTTAAEVEARFPPSWLQLLKPPAGASVGPPRGPLDTVSDQSETQGASLLAAPGSEDEPLMGKRRRGKRSANEGHGEASHSPYAAPKRPHLDGATPQANLSGPPASSTRNSITAALSPIPANNAAQTGLRVVIAPAFQPSDTEIRCRGEMTFKRAKRFGVHGGNYIFQWPPGFGNPFFIIVCEQCKHSAKERGYFWRHPFEGSIKEGLKHFGMHMNEWQILERSGWHVTDARDHLEEMLNHNSTLAEKQPRKSKR